MAKMFEKFFSSFDDTEKKNKKRLEEMDELSFQLREMRYLNVTNREQMDKGIDLIRKTIVELQNEQAELKHVLKAGLKSVQEDVQIFLETRIKEIDLKIDDAVGFLNTLEEVDQQIKEEQEEKFRIFREEIIDRLAEDKLKSDSFIEEMKSAQERILEDEKEEQMLILKDFEKTVNEQQKRRLEEMEAKLEDSDHERRKEFKIVRNYFKAGIWILLINLMFIVVWILGLFG